MKILFYLVIIWTSYYVLYFYISRRIKMAKQKYERTKPHVNIGTIGHV
ncbi:elongation factor Tu, partial [Thermoanaerobacteraceae bacterium SP2]